MASDPHKTLRDDVRLLGELLGETLRRDEGMPHYERVERVRALAKRTRSSSSGDDFEALAEELRAMPVAAALPVARSFAHFLNLANIAEQHHRVRRRRELERELGGRPQLASIEEALPRLLGTGVSPDALFEAICGLRVELVITAHPTEIMRRTLQHKYNRIAAALAGRDRPDLTPTEREALLESMRREIAGAWHTEEVRRERPSPLDEVRSGMAVFEETIWNAVPELCRSLDRTLRRIVKRRPAARCRSHSLRLVDRRRPRRQPVGNPRGHEARGADVALDGVDAVRARSRDAPLRAVDGPRESRAAGPRPGRARAVSRGAA